MHMFVLFTFILNSSLSELHPNGTAPGKIIIITNIRLCHYLLHSMVRILHFLCIKKP